MVVVVVVLLLPRLRIILSVANLQAVTGSAAALNVGGCLWSGTC